MSTFIETELIDSASDFKLVNASGTITAGSDILLSAVGATFYKRISFIENVLTLTGTGNAKIYFKRENGTQTYLLKGSGIFIGLEDFPESIILMPNDEFRVSVDGAGSATFGGFYRTLALSYRFF